MKKIPEKCCYNCRHLWPGGMHEECHALYGEMRIKIYDPYRAHDCKHFEKDPNK